MALIGLDGFVTTLAAAAAQNATTITVVDPAVCTGLGAGNHTYLRIGDGSYFDSVRINSCMGGVLTLAAPLPRAYPAGACVRFVLTSAIVCELIGSGACTSICTPVALLYGANFPDVSPGKIYSHAIVLGGTGPFDIVSDNLPAWMTKTVTGNTVLFGGVAPDPTVDFTANIVISNCGGGQTITVSPTVCRCEPVGL